jgi:hypothetical protein
VFTNNGSYVSPQAFLDGLIPAMWVGVAVLAAGALVAALVPFTARAGSEAGTDLAARRSPSVAVPAELAA